MSNVAQVDTVKNATEIFVSSADELFRALQDASGGETIYLAAGNYGTLDLYDARHAFTKFDSEVTIQSADLEDPGVFNSLRLRGVENLTFESVTFDYEASAGAEDWISPFRIENSSNIKIANSIFDGDLAEGVNDVFDGHGTGHGLSVSGSSNIVIDGNEFFDFKRAAVFGGVDGLEITGNDIHDIRSDGLNFSTVSNVLIESNHLYDFNTAAGSGDHADMIQFWTTGTTRPTENVVIRANILNSGEGDSTQSIFIRNQLVDLGLAGEEMYYQNIVIEDNIIHNGHVHGITVGETNGLVVKSNTILQNADQDTGQEVSVPSINLSSDSKNVVVADNIVPRESNIPAEWSLGNNLVVQNESPELDNYVGDLFVNALAGSQADVTDLKALPGGIVEQMGVGSFLTEYTGSTGHVASDAGAGLNMMTHSFSAIFTDMHGKALDLNGATLAWDFGDGTGSAETAPSHAYSKSGMYDVTASVTLADGSKFQLAKTVEVENPKLFHLDFEDGFKNTVENNLEVSAYSAVEIVSGSDGKSAKLNGGAISLEYSDKLINNSEYSIIADFQKEDASSGGHLFYFTGSLLVTLTDTGVNAVLHTDKGSVNLNAANLGLNDTSWHSLAITFSGEEGTAALYIDGIEVSRADVPEGASQIASSGHTMHLGSPFSKGFTGNVDNVAFIRSSISEDQVSEIRDWVKDPTSSQTPADPAPMPEEPEPVPEEPTDTGGSTSDPVDEDILNLIEGSNANDYLKGTEEADEIYGFGGKDRIFAGEGDDLIYLGDQNWGRAEGQEGNDTIYGGDAHDAIFGGDGDDTIDGGKGSDKLFGGNGNDTIRGGEGRDKLYGEAGDDILIASDADYNSLNGGIGNDTLLGGNGRDYLSGGDDNDVLNGGEGKDKLTGGEGADQFVFGLESGVGDEIVDFDVFEDIFVLEGSLYADKNALFEKAFEHKGALHLNLDGPDSGFSWSTSNYVKILGVSLEDFMNSNVELIA